MKIHENIRRLRENLGFSQGKLAEMVGYKDRSSIAKVEAGEVDLSQSKIAALAKALNVSPAYLMGYEEEPGIPDHPDLLPITKKRFPLIGGVACGEPIYREEDFESYIEAGTDIKADFAMRCHGNSMINIGIKDGFIVFIRKQPKVENGEVAAVNIDGEYTLKRFYNYGNIILLRAENPDFEDIELKEGDVNNITILGKAVAFQGDVK